MLWTSLPHPGIPLTNNAAERALRPDVIWRKISFFSQSYRGNQFRPLILYITETCAGQANRAFAGSRSLFGYPSQANILRYRFPHRGMNGYFYLYIILHSKTMANSDFSISIIISTYNRPESLRLVILALNEQKDKDFEAIVADDGSVNTTAQLIEHIRPQIKFPIKHIWQSDQGFRAAKIRNKAVAQASGDYIIFLDDDCPMPEWFVYNHRMLAEKRFFVAGNRILINRCFTRAIIDKDLPVWRFSRWEWFVHRIKGNTNRFLPVLSLRLFSLRNLHRTKWRGLRSCNLGLWRHDFLNVNGFDEKYVGWGYEDSDLIIRMMRTGVNRKEGFFSVPIFHLWHKMNDRSNTHNNFQALQSIISQKKIFKAEQGIDQYL